MIIVVFTIIKLEAVASWSPREAALEERGMHGLQRRRVGARGTTSSSGQT